jgi:hypothetical protein
MGWKDLLQADDERMVAPWVGGRSLQTYGGRTWAIEGQLPPEYGWYEFKVLPRKVQLVSTVEAPVDVLRDKVVGYLVGNRMVPEGSARVADPAKQAHRFETVFLVEPGLDRFVRVIAGRYYDEGPLIYEGQEFPLGPEEAVLRAFEDKAKSVDDVAEVIPALDAAFRFESWRRAEAERRRREARERREREERRRRLHEQFGNGALRRQVAKEDFGEAAKVALAVGGAEYLSHRRSYHKGEVVVRFRLDGRRFECTCSETLQILDAGICLVDHRTDERGDTYFTLESLPAVIRQAEREGRLVVFRHVD